MQFLPRYILAVFSVVLSQPLLFAAGPSVTVTPATTYLGVGQTIQFSGSVEGLSNASIVWGVSGIKGGNASLGTISSSGVYQAPPQSSQVREGFTITAVASDGKTAGKASVTVEQLGPAIASVSPNPIPPGKYTITLSGSGFVDGAVVRNGAAQLQTTYVSATQLRVAGTQIGTASGVFQIENPNTVWGPAKTVPFKTTGAALVIAPKTVYVHLGDTTQFTAAGANYWTASEGQISQTGQFVAPAAMPASKSVTITAAGPGGSVTAQVTLAAGAEAAISPNPAIVQIGQKQQFTSAGSTVWTASIGTISATGLYTAPAVWPSTGTAQISVNGQQGSATETIKITPPLPAITSISPAGHIPLGPFAITLTGQNFTSSSIASIGGMALPTTYSGGLLQVSGLMTQPGPANLTVTTHTATSAPFAVQIGVANPLVSPAAARRFLEQAAFGPTPSEAEKVQTLGYSAWLSGQLQMAQSSNYNAVKAASFGGMPEQFISSAVQNPDQLRQKVAFALSQIFVTSLIEIGQNQSMITYQNMLMNDAFANYRKIMSDVTLSPAMGQFLNFANNAKADPSVGSVANENYAREMMQLFTLGTSMLNQDGTVQVDANGDPIPTYSQFTVTEFARAYTGWTFPPAPGGTVYWGIHSDNNGPLIPYAGQHDSGSKQLLNGYVSPAGVSATTDLNNALDNIFNHSNIGPFVSTQLIQHLVKSNPSPEYVSRIAAVFNNNGSKVRGDMKAVVTAILLDPEARANDEGGEDKPTDGHLQEPALFVAGMIRAFGGQLTTNSNYHWYLQTMGQDIYSAPSVFNYYAPNYGIANTNLVGGEFQIYSPNTAVVRTNQVTTAFNTQTSPIQTSAAGTTIDLTPYIYLASNPPQLVEALDLTLTHGVMPASMKEALVTAIQGETGGSLRRVQRGCYLILTSSYYNVWH